MWRVGFFFAHPQYKSSSIIYLTQNRMEVCVLLLDDPFAVADHFALTFELRPRRLTGLLFHARAHKTSFDVFLINNTVTFPSWMTSHLIKEENGGQLSDFAILQVGVTVNDVGGSVSVALTPQNLCDGEFHVITGILHS